MFTRQKVQLDNAALLHQAAVRRKKMARQILVRQRKQFLGEPLNLLYPYFAGVLICASQLRNDATGMKRIPFMNIVKAGVGVWTLINRIRGTQEKHLKKSGGNGNANNELI